MVHSAGEKGNVYVVNSLAERGSDSKKSYFVVRKESKILSHCGGISKTSRQ